MKKLLSLLLLVTVQIHAMDRNPNVQRYQQGNIVRYSSAPVPLPEIKIQECAQCGQHALKTCSICKVTYYCAQACQKLNWDKHKSICSEIKKAQNGDIAHMRNIFSAYMKKTCDTSNKDFMKAGLSWHFRTIIRLRQDVACSKDESTQSSIGHVKLEHDQLMNRVIAKNICTQKELDTISDEIFQEAIAWVGAKTEAKELVPPFGIRRYGLAVYLNSEMNMDTEFIPENEWYEKRVAMIEIYRQAFDKASN